MAGATIGDDVKPVYEFEWSDTTRTTDEPWLKAALLEAKDATLEDVVAEAREDSECTVRIIGFGG